MNETMRRDVVIDPTGTKDNLLQTEVEKMGWNSVLSDGKQQFCCCEMEAVYLPIHVGFDLLLSGAKTRP